MGCGDRSVLRPLLGGGSTRRLFSRNVNNNNNNESIELGKKGSKYQRFEDDEMGPLGNSGLTLLFRRISLLIWKNFLFRKRHYVVTALEIVLPTFFAILLAYAKAKIPSDISNSAEGGVPVPTITRFPELDEANLVIKLGTQLACRNCVFAFAPNTVLPKKVIEDLQSVLNGTSVVWKGFNTELEIEAYNQQLGIGNKTATLRGAVIFQEGFDGDDFTASRKLHYKLRFTDSYESTSALFPAFQIPGPNIYNGRAYSDQGFSGLQVLIDKFLIKALTGNGVPVEGMSVQAFPYPPFLQSFDFQQIFNLLMPLLLCLGFVFIVPSIVRGVVGEKETGIKELLKMMGLPNWMHWLGWMMNSLLVLVFSVTIVVFLLFYPFNAATGGVVEHSDPTLWWTMLLLYCMASTAFCFFVSSFFQKPTIATTVGIVLWLVSYFGLAAQMDRKYQYLHSVEKVSLCLVPNVALTFAIKVMGGLEGKAVGARWSNLFEPMNTTDSLSVGIIMLMMICSTTILMALTIYFENILPTEYGVRRPWYYIFQLSTWIRGKVTSSEGEISRPLSGDHRPGFEADPAGIAPGVEIYNLRKKFGSKVAVDDVTLKLFDGQITALLGHNGAGKTTTMSMLTGMFAPTSGRAIVNGHDISTDLEGVRHDLGLCPQHNMLFDKLTVGEHLIFFARLKGLTSSQARGEMVEILKRLQLSDKMNTLSMALSGGQKRKLNLGMALIGGSKVVILDEPTSGMDPEARRAIWDLLLEMRGHRTIALTTHFMEEADVLGDRIAIMAKGKVQCCGSPMFLKRFYGAGYTLSMTVEPEVRPDVILMTLQKYIENASFKHQHAPNSSEIAITLPTDANTTAKFPQMFSELSKNRDELGIKTIGLSLTTMDEVFIKVGELSEKSTTGGEDEVDHSSPESKRSLARSIDGLHANRLTGLRLARQQFYALFVKRMLYTFRKRKLFISQLLIPVLLIIVAINASNSIYQPSDPDPPLKMSLSSYKKPITPYTSTDDVMGGLFAKVVGSSAVKASNDSIDNELLIVGENDLALYRERYIVAAEMNASHIKAMFSTIPFHASPLAINLATNTILRKVMPAGKDYAIEISAQPMKSGVNDLLEAAKPDPLFSKTIPLMFAVILPLGLALLAASFMVFPVEERLCKAKQLQLMTGVNPLIFWVSSLSWDFLLSIALVCVMVACFPIFQSHGSFTAYGGGGVLLLILVVYSFTAINFSYLFSLFPATVAGGFSLLTIFHVFSGMVLCIFIFVMELSGFISEANTIRPFARIFPTFGAAMCTMQFTEIATRNIRCDLIPKEAMTVLCNPSNQIELEFRSCCANCTTLWPTAPCFEPESYISWTTIKRPDVPVSHNEDDMRIPGIGQELMWLFLVGIMYLFILVLVEFGIIKRILSVIFNSKSSGFRGVVDDADVKEETTRVQDMVTSGNLFADAIVVNNLSKSYGSFAAVSNISFGVHHGECFGLLGVNGAGKTTTFRMLTGDEVRSSGNAFTSFCNLEKSRKKFLANIGYCPQFDGIVGVLSGKEMLELFCRLRGVDSGLIHSEAMRWLGNLGLTASADVQCRKYSGGMKRRLSTAMALIGDPPVVLLDEPTSGVDPMARRQFWKVISAVRDSGQAVILTSHSMEECEALCSRLGIMVNGQMQCLGGVQHLKNKFAQGYSLILKLRSMVSSEVNPEVDVLSKEITTKFHPCALKDQHQNVLQYQILNTSLPWDVLFKTMEDLKRNYEHIIEEYSVNETTLEEVFLSFARKQYPNREADVSFLKKLVTCSF